MKPALRAPLAIVGSLAISFVAPQCAPVVRGGATCDGIEIISNELTVADADRLCRYAGEERKKLADYWGASWTESIRIHVASSYRISRALVPGHFGNRGFMEMPLRHLRDHTWPLLHEMVHIYAPHDNRFLAEGLAVYLHTRLAANRAFPNFDEELHRAAARNLAKAPSLQALDAVRTPRPLSTVMDEQTAYILAGSYVGFLIERHGLDLFRKLYGTGNYAAVYGKAFDLMEGEWRNSLAAK